MSNIQVFLWRTEKVSWSSDSWNQDVQRDYGVLGPADWLQTSYLDWSRGQKKKQAML